MAGAGSNWLSGVNVVLVMAYGSLVFVLLFIFVKRQIMRFAMKSRRGPHVPVGQHAPKDLKEEIDIRLSRVQDIKYEPRLLAEDDSRLLQLETQGCYNYLYRMKALDAIRTSEIPFHAEGRYPKSLIGKNFCAYLLELRNSSTSFKGIRKALIDTLLDGYESARYGTGVFGKPEYLQYQDALNELANMFTYSLQPVSFWVCYLVTVPVPACAACSEPGTSHELQAWHLQKRQPWFSKPQ
ncbi:protein C1orf43 homolog isoform 2-T2 [Spheniscus humboldti]